VGCQLFHFLDVHRGFRARGQSSHQIFVGAARRVERLLGLLWGLDAVLATIFELGLHHILTKGSQFFFCLVLAIGRLLTLLLPLSERSYPFIIHCLAIESSGLPWLWWLNISPHLSSCKLLQIRHFICN
jgi:hypothetical protein